MTQVCRPQLDDPPRRAPVPESVADEAVAAQVAANVEGSAVDVDCDALLGDGEVGDGDSGLVVARRYGDLLLDGEAVLLAEAEELQLKRRPDACFVRLKPGARVVDVACLKAARFGLGGCKALQVAYDAWPVQVLVVPLIVVRLETAVARGLAASVVEMLQRS